jgi:hypothetical protein
MISTIADGKRKDRQLFLEGNYFASAFLSDRGFTTWLE